MGIITDSEKRNGNGKFLSVLLRIVFAVLIATMVFSVAGCNTSTNDDDKPLTPISFTLSEYDETEYNLKVGDKESITFYLSVFEASQEDLQIVNSNEQVVSCTFKSVHAVSGKKLAILNITAKAEGKASISLRDVANDTKSTEIKFNVASAEPSEDETESKYANYTVYVNFSGSKFHFKKDCAGPTATTTSYGQALKMNKTPCNKCAMYLDEEVHFVGGADDSQIGQRPTVGSNPELENCVENLCISYNENWSQNRFDGQITASVYNTTVTVVHKINGTSTDYYDYQSGRYDEEIATVISEIKSYFENNIQDILEITVEVNVETRFEVN